MALSFNVKRRVPIGKGGNFLRLHVVEITLDAAYPAGGYVLTASNLGFPRRLDDVIVAGNTLNGFGLSWDAANKKLKAHKYDYDAVADGAAIEAAASEATLDTQVVAVIAIGE